MVLYSKTEHVQSLTTTPAKCTIYQIQFQLNDVYEYNKSLYKQQQQQQQWWLYTEEDYSYEEVGRLTPQNISSQKKYIYTFFVISFETSMTDIVMKLFFSFSSKENEKSNWEKERRKNMDL